MNKTIKSMVGIAALFAAAFLLVTCNVFKMEAPKSNENGYRSRQLKSPHYGGDLNRLAFGVSSRSININLGANKDNNPNEGWVSADPGLYINGLMTTYVDLDENGNQITVPNILWGNIIEDSDEYDDAVAELTKEEEFLIPFMLKPGPNKERRIRLTAINQTNNAGKIAGSEDGITYYFKEVPASKNFRISADFYVNLFGFTGGRAELNGQEAFGFMARDYVPQHQKVGGAGYDLTMAGLREVGKEVDALGNVTKPGKNVSWRGVYWNGQDTSLNDGVSGSSNMIMVGGVKRGTRVYWRTGVSNPERDKMPITDPNTIANADFAKFNYWPREMSDYAIYGAGIDGTKARPDFPTAGLTYKLYLERTNSGFVAKITPPTGVGKGITKNRQASDGFELHYTDKELCFPDMLANIYNTKNLPDAKKPVNDDKYYVGFFVARDAKVTITNIKYEESDADKCPPRVEPEPEKVTPTFSVQSPNATSVEDYTLYGRSNVEGYLQLSINNGEPKIYKGEWVTETTNASAEPFILFKVDTKLKKGDNIFDMAFVPDKKQNISGFAVSRDDARDNSKDYIMANFGTISRSFIVNRRDLPTSDVYKVNPTTGDYDRAGGTQTVNKYNLIWVAPIPEGKATGDGTYNNPLDIKTAIAVSAPRQMIILKDGIYSPIDPPETIEGKVRTPVRLKIPRYNSGLPNSAATAPWKVLNPPEPGLTVTDFSTHPYSPYNDPYYKNYKVLMAENRNMAVFDFRKDWADKGYAPRAFEHWGDYWIIDGIHVRNCYDTYKGLTISGSYNLVRWVKTYFNGDTGLQISGNNTEPKSVWPSNNRIEYCESFGNADLARTNADGFAAKLTAWENNVFYRTVSHHNIDDGYDLFAKKETGPIGALHIQQCFAYFNGRYLNDEMGRNYSDWATLPVYRNNSAGVGGNGFKMGGEGIPVRHLAIDCLSFGNDGDGYTSNSDPAIRLSYISAVDNYNRQDVNPGSNISIYSSSSPSYEGLDGILTQVFSWQSGNIIIGRDMRRKDGSVHNGVTIDKNNYMTILPLKGLADIVVDKKDSKYGEELWVPKSDTDPTLVKKLVGVQGKRNDRAEPVAPSSGYVWRNYDTAKKYGDDYFNSVGNIFYAVYDGNNEKDTSELEGKSISTSYVNGRFTQNNTTVNRYVDSRKMEESDFVSYTANPEGYKLPHEMLKTRIIFSKTDPDTHVVGTTPTGLAPWPINNADKTEGPYARMPTDKDPGKRLKGSGGHVEGEFFDIFDQYNAPGDAYYWGLPNLGNFMRLNDLPGGSPGARGLWKD